jgi:hypothetical protein
MKDKWCQEGKLQHHHAPMQGLAPQKPAALSLCCSVMACLALLAFLYHGWCTGLPTSTWGLTGLRNFPTTTTTSTGPHSTMWRPHPPIYLVSGVPRRDVQQLAHIEQDVRVVLWWARSGQRSQCQARRALQASSTNMDDGTSPSTFTVTNKHGVKPSHGGLVAVATERTDNGGHTARSDRKRASPRPEVLLCSAGTPRFRSAFSGLSPVLR